MRESQPSAIPSLIDLRAIVSAALTRFAGAIALALSPNAFAAGHVAIDAQAAYTYDDNVTRASRRKRGLPTVSTLPVCCLAPYGKAKVSYSILATPRCY